MLCHMSYWTAHSFDIILAFLVLTYTIRGTIICKRCGRLNITFLCAFLFSGSFQVLDLAVLRLVKRDTKEKNPASPLFLFPFQDCPVLPNKLKLDLGLELRIRLPNNSSFSPCFCSWRRDKAFINFRNGVAQTKMNGHFEDVWTLNDPLEKADPEVYGIIQKEKRRQTASLEMIASENFTSLAVLDCLSSCVHNKYSEGQPGARY